MTQTPTALTLYDQDYLLWTEDTVNQLRNKNFHRLDLVNLIEEIEDLEKSQKRELKSRLGELLEHILKRTYIDMPDCYRGWVESVDKQRIGLRRLLKDSPSLKPYLLEVFDEVYTDTLIVVCRSYPQCKFPKKWPFECNLEALLTIDFWLN
ncbi:MAG: DUF29 domain-containing protein [Snowella sp.]|nr:DUF29 domain-containing protein [Snowella sp.]